MFCSGGSGEEPDDSAQAADVTLKNPASCGCRYVSGQSNLGLHMVWQLPAGGGDTERCGILALDASPRQDGDVLVFRGRVLYAALQSASGGTLTTISPERGESRRMKRRDASYTDTGAIELLSMEQQQDYHYFKYEPIEWRVLHGRK